MIPTSQLCALCLLAALTTTVSLPQECPSGDLPEVHSAPALTQVRMVAQVAQAQVELSKRPPGMNFDLSRWKITFPDATEEPPAWLEAGSRENEFFTDPETGAMVFRCPNIAKQTSENTKYSRTELRELVYGGLTKDGKSKARTKGVTDSNWVLSTAWRENRQNAGGIDGVLTATLSVDHVSTTGERKMIGRVIVGQIHGEHSEPCRIYYRLLPGHKRGSVYVASESFSGEEESYIELIGSRSSSAKEPSNGIELGEKWSYEINVVGRRMVVTVTKADGKEYSAAFTLDNAYKHDYLYFKAGVYNQNNGGAKDDYTQASFYALRATHDSYQ